MDSSHYPFMEAALDYGALMKIVESMRVGNWVELDIIGVLMSSERGVFWTVIMHNS